MGTRPLLEVTRLGKRFKSPKVESDLWVLRELTFSVGEGEFLTIIGPSGAGKTTLLNVLAQIDFPTEGEIRFLSEPASPRSGILNPGLSCRIGYVMQDDTLLPWRTALENVLLPLRLQRRLTAAGEQHADELIGAVGLRGFENFYPHQLSGGMRKRVALARTLVYDPPIILMDEPFGSVDAETRSVLQQDLLNLWRDRRKTIIFVTHDITEAIALGERALVLTPPPARVKREYSITLPSPRDIRDVVAHQEFQHLYRAIRAEVRWDSSSPAQEELNV